MCTVRTVHTKSATRSLKDGSYLQITFMTYNQYYPQILGVDAQNTLFHIFYP